MRIEPEQFEGLLRSWWKEWIEEKVKNDEEEFHKGKFAHKYQIDTDTKHGRRMRGLSEDWKWYIMDLCKVSNATGISPSQILWEIEQKYKKS